MKRNLYHFYMQTAMNAAKMSYAERLKVGAVIVTQSGAMYPGYNGTISGFENKCENEDGTTNNDITIHSEKNALYKMLAEGVSAKGSTMFTTHSCCASCAQMAAAVGIERVVYNELYRDEKPLLTLKKAGIIVEKYDESI